MFVKSTFFLALIAAIFIGTCLSLDNINDVKYPPESDKEGTHNVAAGKRYPDDKLAYFGFVTKFKSFNSIVSVEKTFYARKNQKITQVLARNQAIGRNGGYAKIIKGGPGRYSVTIKFTSQKNHGIIFLVEVFSKP